MNDVDGYDDIHDVHEGDVGGNCFPGEINALSGPDGALNGKSDTGFMDEELFMMFVIRTYMNT